MLAYLVKSQEASVAEREERKVMPERYMGLQVMQELVAM